MSAAWVIVGAWVAGLASHVAWSEWRRQGGRLSWPRWLQQHRAERPAARPVLPVGLRETWTVTVPLPDGRSYRVDAPAGADRLAVLGRWLVQYEPPPGLVHEVVPRYQDPLVIMPSSVPGPGGELVPRLPSAVRDEWGRVEWLVLNRSVLGADGRVDVAGVRMGRCWARPEDPPPHAVRDQPWQRAEREGAGGG